MDLPEEVVREGREKLKQVFRYLQALQLRRFPPTRLVSDYDFKLYLDDVPDHPNTSKLGDEYVLRIRRPQLQPCPPPPPSIVKWLRKGWEVPIAIPLHHESLINGDGATETFEAINQRVETWNNWLRERSMWAPQATIDQNVNRIYQQLYEQHSVLERDGEQYELIIGDGFVRWATTGGAVDHPLLLQPVDLTFNPQDAEFTISLTARPVELYTGPISTEATSRSLSKAREQVAASSEIHPLDTETTNPFLRGLATSLDDNGEFVKSPPTTAADFPQIYRKPVVFRRNRSTGMIQAIRQALDDLEDQSSNGIDQSSAKELPEGLLRFVGIDTRPEDPSGNGDDGTRPADEDEATFFTKPGNREQYQIVRKLNKSGCVLVQGPPGTGKTHTIANLIGHLLANGKSVLVTSHTTKALSVVIEKVAPPLQPLCVSVLETDIKNRERLEQSVQSIAEHVAEGVETFKSRVTQFTTARSRLFTQIRELRRRLHAAQASEYEPIGFLGESILPIDAAREVRRDRDNHGWIPGIIADQDQLPLSLEELIELYETNVSVSSAEEANCPDDAPEIGELPEPDNFATLVNKYNELSVAPGEFPQALIIRAPADDILLIEHAVRLTHEMVTFFASQNCGWRTKIVEMAATDAKIWTDLAHEASELGRRVTAVEDGILRIRPVWKDHVEPREAIRICAEIEEFLAAGRSLNKLTLLTKPAWKRTVDSFTTAEGPAATVQQFSTARLSLELKGQRQQFVRVWNGRMTTIDGPQMAEDCERPEVAARLHVRDIRACLSWHSTEWAKTQSAIERTGISVSKAHRLTQTGSEYGSEIDRLIATLTNVVMPAMDRLTHRIHLREANDRLTEATQLVTSLLAKMSGVPLIQNLAAAALSRDMTGYRDTHAEIVAVFGKSDTIARRRHQLRQLGARCPNWAQAIKFREGVHGRRELPGDLNAAWRWKRLDSELERRAKVSVQDLITSLASAQEQAQDVTTRLVEAMSWGHLAERTKMHTRTALIEYVQILRRIGRGTGRRVPRLVREAQRAMAESQGSVPVWVMPLSRIVDSFNVSKSKFDVVIIDESSQLDLMGLIAMYMAKQVIIVGDDKQVEPLAVGAKLDETQSLIDEHLSGIPRNQLWDGKQSVYSLAEGPFEPIRLREHFRCVPDIIRFSNNLSYDGSILPLREEARVVTRPFVVPYYVPNATEQNRVNLDEAHALVALLKACTEQPEYRGKSFGVIHLVGEDASPQNYYVRQLVRKHFSEVEIENMRFRCGNSAQFQGDERDVVFLSIADVPRTGPLPVRKEDMFQKRYNVAASRARDQMWVLYSLNPETDLKTEDLRLRLIQHALNPRSGDALEAEIEERTESDFERRMLSRLIACGYTNIEPQYWVGAYRLDFAIKQGKLRVAIECDGDRYHTSESADEDLARQSTLERLGWKFIRIRGSEFYRDEDCTVTRVASALAALGVEQSTAGPGNGEPQESDLLNRVKSRAAELLAQWREAGASADSFQENTEPQPSAQSSGGPRQAEESGTGKDSKTETATCGTGRNKARPASSGLGRYQRYEGTDLPDPKATPISILTSKLAEIVEVEGPATIRTILDRYRVGAGFGKLRGPTKDTLEGALKIAIASRRIVLLTTDENDPTGSVVALPASPPVRLRERGPRELADIPVDEIAALVRHLDLIGESEEIAFGELLIAYGPVRKTDGVKLRLRKAIVIAAQPPLPTAEHIPPRAHDKAPETDRVAGPSTAEALRDKNGEIYRLRVYSETQEVVLLAGIAVRRAPDGEAIRWTIQPENGTETREYLCPPMVVKRLKKTT